MPTLSPARQRLVVRYLPLARSLCRPFLADWPGRYDEFVSAADLGLCEAAARYRKGRARFSTYAKIRIVYALMDQVRQFAKEHKCQNNYLGVEALPERTPRRGAIPCHVGAELEAAEELEHLIDGFPVEYRPMIRLLFVEGLSQVETARRLGTSRAALRHRLRSAFQSRDAQCA